MGKPSYDFIIDDKSYNYDNKYKTKIEEQIKINIKYTNALN